MLLDDADNNNCATTQQLLGWAGTQAMLQLYACMLHSNMISNELDASRLTKVASNSNSSQLQFLYSSRYLVWRSDGVEEPHSDERRSIQEVLSKCQSHNSMRPGCAYRYMHTCIQCNGFHILYIFMYITIYLTVL